MPTFSTTSRRWTLKPRIICNIFGLGPYVVSLHTTSIDKMALLLRAYAHRSASVWEAIGRKKGSIPSRTSRTCSITDKRLAGKLVIQKSKTRMQLCLLLEKHISCRVRLKLGEASSCVVRFQTGLYPARAIWVPEGIDETEPGLNIHCLNGIRERLPDRSQLCNSDVRVSVYSQYRRAHPNEDCQPL